MKLQNKVALVTGGARGIGRGCALELARAGADVVVNDRESTPQAAGVVREIGDLGRKAWVVAGDVFQRASCESVVARTIEAAGRIDIFVSNPARNDRAGFLEYDPATFDAVIDATLGGGFHMSQLVARHMVARGGRGKMVFISSVHARIPFTRNVAYNAAKLGLINMACTIAAELLPHRINVNVIEPGWIDTPGERIIFGEETIDQAGSGMPWGRLGRPEDIGKAAAFLCSDDADYITGASLLVDGGFCLQEACKGG
ncbi:MAG: SDR family oxidoreductase [Isosphaeraceae bacterium]